MSGQCSSEWNFWLPLVEQWYNTNFYSATQLTPFKIVYNQPQPHHMPYLPRECEHEKVDRPFILKTNIHILLVNCNFPFVFS